ncbi:MAG: hypothetical protein RR922_03510 [Clostridia bacterium]
MKDILKYLKIIAFCIVVVGIGIYLEKGSEMWHKDKNIKKENQKVYTSAVTIDKIGAKNVKVVKDINLYIGDQNSMYYANTKEGDSNIVLEQNVTKEQYANLSNLEYGDIVTIDRNSKKEIYFIDTAEEISSENLDDTLALTEKSLTIIFKQKDNIFYVLCTEKVEEQAI